MPGSQGALFPRPNKQSSGSCRGAWREVASEVAKRGSTGPNGGPNSTAFGTPLLKKVCQVDARETWVLPSSYRILKPELNPRACVSSPVGATLQTSTCMPQSRFREVLSKRTKMNQACATFLFSSVASVWNYVLLLLRKMQGPGEVSSSDM